MASASALRPTIGSNRIVGSREQTASASEYFVPHWPIGSTIRFLKRTDLAALIAATPELDWLLLTKRIELFDRLAPWPRHVVPDNVWIGVTAENQEYFDRRWPKLRDFKTVRFISYEPALGPLALGKARRIG
jgi:protein gp37